MIKIEVCIVSPVCSCAFSQLYRRVYVANEGPFSLNVLQRLQLSGLACVTSVRSRMFVHEFGTSV